MSAYSPSPRKSIRTLSACHLRSMREEDLPLVEVQICRVLAKVIEGFAVVVLDELATSVIVSEERPEGVAGAVFGVLDGCEESRKIVATILFRKSSSDLHSNVQTVRLTSCVLHKQHVSCDSRRGSIAEAYQSNSPAKKFRPALFTRSMSLVSLVIFGGSVAGYFRYTGQPYSLCDPQ